MQLGLRRTGRTVIVAGSFNVDTTAPTPVVLSVTPPIAGPVPGAFEIRARGVGRRRAPRFRVLRTDVDPAQGGRALPRPQGQPPRRLGRARRRRARAARDLHGRRARSATAPATSARAPAVLPPVPGQVRGKPGITVRQITAQPPRRAGARRRARRSSSSTRAAAPTAGASAASARRAPIKKGTRRAGQARSPSARPRGISGAYLLQVRSGRYSARVPFLVQAPERARLLVVVPAISWLGVDKVDDDGDGLPEHARDRRPGEVAARDRWRPGAAAPTFADRDRAAARLPRPRADPLRPHLRHRARPLARPARDRSRGRGPRRLAALDPAPARAPAARATSRTAGGWRASAPISMRRGVRDRRRTASPSPTQPTPIDPFGARLEPVADPRTERRRPDAAAADRARRGPGARPADRLRRRARRVRPARGVRQRARRHAAPRCSPRSARTSPTPSAPRPRRTGELPREALPGADRDAARQGHRDPRRPDASGRSGPGPDREVAQITHNIVDILRRVRPRVRSAGR